ncbi:MAG: hypothetical protein AABZ53_04765 [Planctomycetota bacterium]
MSKLPPSPKLGLAWFEFPSDLNPVLTSVSGHETLDTSDPSFGLEVERDWPIDRRGFTLPAGLFPMPELDKFFHVAGWRTGSEVPENELLHPGVCALGSACATLLVIHTLPQTKILQHSTGSLGVMIGWADGDYMPIGVLNSKGWGPLKRTPRVAPPRPEELKPEDGRFDAFQFIKAGKDPRQLDKRTRTPLLMRIMFPEFKMVEHLIKHGADASALDRKRQNMLHTIGADELPLLRVLLDAGAGANQVDASGRTPLDRIVNDGRCTVAHVDLIWSRGGRLGRRSTGRTYPIHMLCEDAFGDCIPQLVDWWLKHGQRLEGRDGRGRTPLWAALKGHADEVEWKAKNPEHASPLGEGSGVAVILMLLARGANPNTRLRQSPSRLIPPGATPLMVRRYTSVRLIRELLRRGADPHAKCTKGLTALDYARIAAHKPDLPQNAKAPQIVRLLERAMG